MKMAIQSMPNNSYVSIGPDGTLAMPVVTPPGLRFKFSFLDCLFLAETRSIQEIIELDLISCLAPLPYTAEAPELRRAAHAIISETQINKGFRLVVSSKQQIYFLASMMIPQPMKPADLITAITGLLVAAKPYISALKNTLAMSTGKSD